jgi:hypothetical protein
MKSRLEYPLRNVSGECNRIDLYRIRITGTECLSSGLSVGHHDRPDVGPMRNQD